MVHLGQCLRTASTAFSAVMKKAASALASIPGPQQYPIIGSLPSYWSGKYDRFKYQKVLHSLNQEYGPVVKETFGDKTIVHVFHPEDIKTVIYLYY
jgi:hypothetical protein